MVKNPPANAEDMGSTPSLGRSHMLWSNQLLSLWSRAHALQRERPRQREARALQPQGSPRLLQREEARAAAETPHSHKKGTSIGGVYFGKERMDMGTVTHTACN